MEAGSLAVAGEEAALGVATVLEAPVIFAVGAGAAIGYGIY